MRTSRLLLALALLSTSFGPAALAVDVARGPEGRLTPVAGAPAQALPALPAAPALQVPQAPTSVDAAAPQAEAAPAASQAPAPPAQAGEVSADEQAAAALRQEKPAVAARFDELKQAFGAADAGRTPESAGAPAPSLAPSARTEPITAVDARGLTRQLSYDPAVPAEPLYKAGWRFLRELPERVRRIRRYRARVKELVAGITDENLWWSINRLKALELQEGILRSDNRALVNQWPGAGAAVKKAAHEDFAESSLESESLMKLFKSAMDLEEPTLQYQYAFAQNLHNRLHRMSHFLGTTLQEHILAVALKGKTNQWSIWANEEVRHGPVLERVYNNARAPSQPPLTQQGEAPRLPRNDAQYLVLSGMANRSLAELFAASAYLTIKANAKPGSGVDVALDGLYRDEVYHYIIMAAVNRFVFGQGRWERLYRIVRHDYDYNPGAPEDKVIHRRTFMSPLAYWEVAYAIFSIDKRIDRFIKTQLNAEKAADLIGPTYVTDAELEASIARGEQTLTKPFRMEQNPHLSQEDVELLEKRMPAGWIDASERKISVADVNEVIETYRKTLLRNPEYWLRRKGFIRSDHAPAGARMMLVRHFPVDDGSKHPKLHAIMLDFPRDGGSPVVRIGDSFRASLDELSMRQIGAIMDAEDLGVIEKLGELKTDFTPQEIMDRVGKTPAYMRRQV